MTYYHKLVLSAVLSMTAFLAVAQSHVLSFGICGGGTTLLQQSGQNVKDHVGGLGGIDVGYTFYAPLRSVQMGVRTGIGLNYGAVRLDGSFKQQYTNTDYLGNEMRYTTSGNLYVRQQMLMMNIPVMMALRVKGFTFNTGVYLQSFLWQQAAQQITNPLIDAYYPMTDVHVTNEIITGMATDGQLSSKKHFGAPAIGLGVGIEIGYEFPISRGWIGVQALVRYAVCNNYEPVSSPVIRVSAISNPDYPVPDIRICPAVQSIVSKTNPLEFALKLYYAFEGI